MFVTSQADDVTIARSKPKQAYQASPFEEERKAFADQVNYLKSMYYHGRIVLGKGDREAYYSLAQIGCISESKVKKIIKNM